MILRGMSYFFTGIHRTEMSFDKVCVPFHSNGEFHCKIDITYYEKFSFRGEQRIRAHLSRFVSLVSSSDRVISFQMSSYYDDTDPSWSPIIDKGRNLTVWVDQTGSRSVYGDGKNHSEKKLRCSH